MTALEAAASARRRCDDGLALGEVVGRVAVVAVGGDDEDDAVALADGAGHRARGLGRLVVRMGVDEDNG